MVVAVLALSAGHRLAIAPLLLTFPIFLIAVGVFHSSRTLNFPFASYDSRQLENWVRLGVVFSLFVALAIQAVSFPGERLEKAVQHNSRLFSELKVESQNRIAALESQQALELYFPSPESSTAFKYSRKSRLCPRHGLDSWLQARDRTNCSRPLCQCTGHHAGRW